MSKHHVWQTQAQYKLEHKGAELNDKQWKTYELEFIMRAILKAPEHIQDENQLAAFKKETEDLIEAIPGKEDQKIFAKDFTTQFTRYKSMLIKQYKLVPKGYYTGIWVAIGLALGTSIGLTMGNFPIGIAIGISLGVAIGASLNAKAEKEGKVL